MQPNNALESRSPQALLAMAEAGHGVAIIPSALRTQGYRLRIARVTYRKKGLSEPLHLLFDRRRPQAPYAAAFCEMLEAFDVDCPWIVPIAVMISFGPPQ